MDKEHFNILVADDDEIARDVVSTLLRSAGYAVAAAADGLAAIELLKSTEYPFVITDLKMPGADGIEVLKQALHLHPDSAVVILTAYGTLDTTLEAMSAGAYDYLTKPFKSQEIMILADRVFHRAELIADNRALRRELRDVYADSRFIGAAAAAAGDGAAQDWADRLDRLVALHVLAPAEAAAIRERQAW